MCCMYLYDRGAALLKQRQERRCVALRCVPCVGLRALRRVLADARQNSSIKVHTTSSYLSSYPTQLSLPLSQASTTAHLCCGLEKSNWADIADEGDDVSSIPWANEPPGLFTPRLHYYRHY